jgi:hypothetical protein
MKLQIILSIFFLIEFYSCNKLEDVNTCKNINIPITSLENEYGCVDTKDLMKIDLLEDYIIIRNQDDFDSLVSGSCNPIIDFDTYDLVIGKKGLPNGNNTIYYKLYENCETKSLTLQVSFINSMIMIAPNLTYHSLIPKLKNGQNINVEILIN